MRSHIWILNVNIRRVIGITDNNRGGKDSGKMKEAVASQWQAWWIGKNNGGLVRGKWSQGLKDNNGGVDGVSRRESAPEWTSLTAEVVVYLRSQGIENEDGWINGEIRSRGLSDDNGGVGGGIEIYDTSEGSETNTGAVGAQQQSQTIYKDNRSVGRGRWALRLWQQQRRRWQRIDDVSKILEVTTDVSDAWQHEWWIGNNYGVSILLAILLLTLTLVAVWSYCCSTGWICLGAAQWYVSCHVSFKIYAVLSWFPWSGFWTSFRRSINPTSLYHIGPLFGANIVQVYCPLWYLWFLCVLFPLSLARSIWC